MRFVANVLVFLGAVLVFAGGVAAQGADRREVGSPFQEEFDFTIGQTLDLNIRIDGINWSTLRAGAGDEADWREGKKIKTSFTNELENLTNTPLTLSVIILLEDDRGRQLERIELKKIKVGAGRYDEDIQKIKVDGGVLAETSKVYTVAEVE